MPKRLNWDGDVFSNSHILDENNKISEIRVEV